jgi:asparagine synthase (glutamine-hydrolysing)
MCGFAGFLTGPGSDLSSIRQMTDRIVHRGPDDQGAWTDPAAGIALGHRRLSIIDLSASGHQPMVSKNGRLVIIYNGELYNHAELRRELDRSGKGPAAAGVAWTGHSDTETLLECIAAWGLEATLKRAIGMFALALWDKAERTLQLARDRFGEKPLYYGWSAGAFVFASELKAIRALPGFANDVDRQALRLLAARAYIPAPLSIYRGIYKLEPGCILTARGDAWRSHVEPAEARRGGGKITIDPYWSYRDVVAEGLQSPFTSQGEALEALEQALTAAVTGQAVADVPVGTFLSGGIDSSTVVGLLQRCSPGQVKTFSIGFEEAGYNEAEHAKAVARHFGTDHHEQYVRVAEARDVIPLLPGMYDEPFADSSQIPTYLVSRFARGSVTVALSGDGGDELFAGYNRYFGAARLWQQLSRLPRPLRSAVGSAFAHVPPSAWNRGSRLFAAGRRPGHFGTKVQKAFRTMAGARDLPDVFNTFLDEWASQPSPVLDAHGDSPYGRLDLDIGRQAPDVVRMMYCDATAYLPDDILCKVDRASMAVSLETRVPFLDHRVAAVAARVPLEMKVRGGEGKWLLKQFLYTLAPKPLFDRPKSGFAVPVGDWLRGPLRDWGESLLSPERLRGEGYLDPALVRQRWNEHQQGRRDATQALWPLLMFQAWQDEFGTGPASTALASTQGARAA